MAELKAQLQLQVEINQKSEEQIAILKKQNNKIRNDILKLRGVGQNLDEDKRNSNQKKVVPKQASNLNLCFYPK